LFGATMSIGESSAGDPIQRVPYVKGIENPTEGLENIIRWLIRHGYTDEQIAKAAGGNILRVLEQVWV
jgi:membrane dipeptidase